LKIGSPPFWATPHNQDEALEQDKGDFYRDSNAARFPTYPTEPAVRALLTVNSYVDLGVIDIMACASTLGNLFRFSRSIPSVFRFNAEMIGNTVFLIRKENSPTELIKDVKGYGHTFPAAYTKWDDGLEKSTSHQRVITYDFGGLQCLVRFGCDGYIKNPSLVLTSATAVASADLPKPLLATSDIPVSGQQLQIENIGTQIDQEFIFEIKTRYIAHKVDMKDMIPKLWITQTPGFLEANYDKPGIFLDPQIRDVKSDVDKWEKENASALSRFHAVLARIRDVVGEAVIGCVEVSWQGSGPLKITEALPENGVMRRALPVDLVEQWRAKLYA
jgi:hypothetical protein